MQERKLTKPEAKAKERIVKDLKGAKADFKKRYGKDAEAVMYATATKRAKKIAEADLGTVEPIVSALILIFGAVGIKVGFDQLIKLTDKYVAPAIDRFYGKVGAGAEFTRKHLKTLYSAYTQGKEIKKCRKRKDIIGDYIQSKGRPAICVQSTKGQRRGEGRGRDRSAR